MSRYRCPRCRRFDVASPLEPCWQCAGEERLTDKQRAYIAAVDELELRTYPHCDRHVLHARGTCRYCSMGQYHRLHELRRRMGIAYSGSTLEPDHDPCPSEAWRPSAAIERWPGNRASPV